MRLISLALLLIKAIFSKIRHYFHSFIHFQVSLAKNYLLFHHHFKKKTHKKIPVHSEFFFFFFCYFNLFNSENVVTISNSLI